MPVPNEERLIHGAAIAQLVLDILHPPPAGDVAQVFERDPTALAVFPGPGGAPEITNAAWRALFGEDAADRPGGGLPADAHQLFEAAARDGAPAVRHELELPTAAGPRGI